MHIPCHTIPLVPPTSIKYQLRMKPGEQHERKLVLNLSNLNSGQTGKVRHNPTIGGISTQTLAVGGLN